MVLVDVGNSRATFCEVEKERFEAAKRAANGGCSDILKLVTPLLDEAKISHLKTQTLCEMVKSNSVFAKKMHFVSVNCEFNETLKAAKNECFCDLAPRVKATFGAFASRYAGLGVDRMAACLGVREAVVVDAGSAITADIVRYELSKSNLVLTTQAGESQKQRHLGGGIMPGFTALGEAFKAVSPKLDLPYNEGISLEEMPLNTQDAISFGALSAACGFVLSFAAKFEELPLVFTGGNGLILQSGFEKLLKTLNLSRELKFDGKLVFRGMLRSLLKD